MLVLTRKANETIVIGDSITVTVLQARGNTIRLGITAPRSVRVVRGELERHDQSSKTDSVPNPAVVSDLVIEYQTEDKISDENHLLPLSAHRAKIAGEHKSNPRPTVAAGPVTVPCKSGTNRFALEAGNGKTPSSDRPLQEFLLSAKLRIPSVSAAAQ